MKEIFTAEFKKFMEEHPTAPASYTGKSTNTLAHGDPRWNPEILKNCPYLVVYGDTNRCCFGSDPSEICPPDRCRLLDTDKDSIE